MKTQVTFLFALLLIGNLLAQNNLSVMTFNIRYDNPGDGENRWQNRKSHVADVLRFFEADVCGVQEALGHQVQELASLLPEYAWTGIGRDSAGTGEFACIFYKKKNLTLLQSGTFWLNEHPERIGPGWDANLNRIVTWACFRRAAKGDTIYVFNTHFDHQGQVARRESAKLLLSRLKSIAGNQPVIVCGDFNATPDDEPIRLLNAPGALTETRSISETPISARKAPLMASARQKHGTSPSILYF
jgi:endonuclease/exonuclease/phosphatase family metal-dependent hydrolase